ncbi:carbohydrate ABC transporter substrate-binding protein [Rhodobacteraceae bacterium CCMM004]|nr:carbohydrate ABC transporter substrate-binding protein [Rhodobacteraceae bacterium CCMM004]
MSDTTISGIAWDHRRCWGPLDADVARARAEDGIDIHWARRSLYSFGEGDLRDFVDDHDLIIFDHPFVGDIATQGLMLDLGTFLTPAEATVFRQNTVGASYRSYEFEGGVYGLPIDSAATTSAWRADLMEAAGLAVPDTLEDVIALGRAARERDKWVAWAAKPTDLMCAYIAMIASWGYDLGREDGPFAPRDMSAAALARIMELREVIHPKSFVWNPIQLFDHMTSHDDVVFTPYAFNYINYAYGGDRVLTFGPPPRLSGRIRPRGLLGGAGIGVSARSANPEAAFRYAMTLVSPEFQAGPYVADGGQPGMRAAWVSPECDKVTNGFFSNCLQAMDDAYLRPTLPGFVGFFHEATLRLAAVVNEGASHDAYVDWQTGAYDALCADRRPAAAE